MKKMIGMMAIALAAALAFTACDNGGGGGGDDNGGSSGPSFLGDTLELSGQVYEQVISGNSVSYKAFNGSETVTSPGGGSGAITNGQLAFIIGTPTSTITYSKLKSDELRFNEYWDNVQPSSSNLQFFALINLYGNVSGYDGVFRGNLSGNPTNNTQEQMMYLYVSGDITISGTGRTEYEDGYTYISKDFSLALKQGWNTLYLKFVTSGSTETATISLSNPNLKWILGRE